MSPARHLPATCPPSAALQALAGGSALPSSKGGSFAALKIRFPILSRGRARNLVFMLPYAMNKEIRYLS